MKNIKKGETIDTCVKHLLTSDGNSKCSQKYSTHKNNTPKMAIDQSDSKRWDFVDVYYFKNKNNDF